MKTYRIWKHLVIDVFFFIVSCRFIHGFNSDLQSDGGERGRDGLGLHSHQHKPNRSEFSGHSVVTGDAQ